MDRQIQRERDSQAQRTGDMQGELSICLFTRPALNCIGRLYVYFYACLFIRPRAGREVRHGNPVTEGKLVQFLPVFIFPLGT